MRRSSEVGMLLIALCAISWAISSPSLAFSYTLNIFGNANMDDAIDELDIAYLEDVIAGHASSVKTSMHRIRLPSFLRSIFAEKVQAHRVLISTNSSFWLNSKVQNEIII